MRFLIVDDSAEFRAATRELLEFRGHVVVGEAGEAEAALDIVKRSRPDAAVVDVRLGEESGFALAKALADAQPGLAVLLVSVSEDVPAEVVRACGARAFVEKRHLHQVDLVSLLRV